MSNVKRAICFLDTNISPFIKTNKLLFVIRKNAPREHAADVYDDVWWCIFLPTVTSPHWGQLLSVLCNFSSQWLAGSLLGLLCVLPTPIRKRNHSKKNEGLLKAYLWFPVGCVCVWGTVRIWICAKLCVILSECVGVGRRRGVCAHTRLRNKHSPLF